MRLDWLLVVSLGEEEIRGGVGLFSDQVLGRLVAKTAV